jgi:hypothetical protein
MKNMVSENVHDFMNPEEDPELSAIEAVEDDEFTTGESGEEDIDYEIPEDEIIQTIRSELNIPEYSRKSLSVMLKDGLVIDGIPMGELNSGDFLFKIDGQIKKIRLNQILGLDFTPELEEEINENFDSEYTFSDYIQEIADYIKTEVYLGEDDQDLIDYIKENQDLWDLQNLFDTGVSSEKVAIQILKSGI